METTKKCYNGLEWVILGLGMRVEGLMVEDSGFTT